MTTNAAKQKLLKHLQKVYGKSDSQHIINSLTFLNNTPQKNVIKDKDWYKKLNIYVTYPNSFKTHGTSPINSITKQLPYLNKLGVNALHILPFLESPMIDLGFDVSNYKKIRPKLGTMRDFNTLVENAKQNNIEIFMDMVFNHVSDQHEWFKKAISGNTKYRDYFLHSNNKPVLLRTEQRNNGSFAIYQTKKGQVACRIIFPDFVGEIPHFFKAKDGYWYYHTFYRSQPDLNWYNKQVFIEFANILDFWSKKGLNFRLDAVTFMAKDYENGNIESNQKLHDLIKALNILTKQVSPKSVFLVETAQKVSTVKKYFGKDEVESELAYNFNLMNAIWSAILNKNSKHLWKSLQKSFEKVPEWSYWVNFIRNHDELTLEFATSKQRKIIHNRLSQRGLSFRQGYGIAGRTKSLLENDNNRLLLSYFLLVSLPGNPAIIYGDEVGKVNDVEYLDNQQKYKQFILGIKDAKKDARDINRGIITQQDIKDNLDLYIKFSKIFNARLKKTSYFINPPSPVKHDLGKTVFYAKYKNNKQDLYVCINLSKTKTHKLSLDKKSKIVSKCGALEIDGNSVVLKPLSGYWATKKQPRGNKKAT